MTTGEKIATLRRERHMSQEALAERLSLSRQAVSKWEADLAMPGTEKLLELSRIFGVPVDELLKPDRGEAETGAPTGTTMAGDEGAQPPTAQPPTAQPPTAQPPTAQPPTVKPPTVKPPTVKKAAHGRGWRPVVITALVVFAAGLALWIGLLEGRIRALDEETEQIRGLISSVQTQVVTVPAPAAQELSELSDYDCEVLDYRPGDTGSGEVLLLLRATPKKFERDAEAEFSIQGRDGSVSVPATLEQGAFAAQAWVPLGPSMSALLLLYEGTSTRTLLLESLDWITDQYLLGLEASLSGTQTLSDGTLQLDVMITTDTRYPYAYREDGGEECFNWVVRGEVELIVDGASVEKKWIEGFEGAQPQQGTGTEGAALALSTSYYTYFTCAVPWTEDSEGHFLVRTVDRFGAEWTKELPIYGK